MTKIFLMILTAIFFYILLSLYLRWKTLARANYIRRYMFPTGLLDKLGALRPELQLKDKQLVARALRQYFIAHLNSGRKFVSMPSQVVDDLWHEFILYTRHYEDFCNKAFGQFMHHTPAVVLGSNHQDNSGLRRVWWYSCLEENINPRAASRLPLLFAIDSKLNISNGFTYTLDCSGIKREGSKSGTVYCGGDMSSSSFDGTTDGFGDSASSDGSGDSSGSGDSGGGCGGGCGGGGGD